MSRRRRSGASGVVIAVFVVLFIVATATAVIFGLGFFTQRNTLNDAIQIEAEKKAEAATAPLQEKLDEANASIIAKESEIDELTTQVDELNAQIEALMIEVEDLKKNWLIKQEAEGTLKVAYITFGSSPSDNTSEVLDILKQYNVKATFFVCGDMDNGVGSRLLARIAEEGHTIGNNTYSRKYSTIYASADAFMDDFNKLDAMVYNATGLHTEILRFPGGSNNRASSAEDKTAFMKDLVNKTAELGYVHYDWNVDPTYATVTKGRDDLTAAEVIVEETVAQCSGKRRPVIILTESSNRVVEALPQIIERLTEEGYVFKALKKDSVTVQFVKPD